MSLTGHARRPPYAARRPTALLPRPSPPERCPLPPLSCCWHAVMSKSPELLTKDFSISEYLAYLRRL